MKKTIKRYLKNKIPASFVDDIPSSYDILGSREKALVIIDISEELEEYSNLIAEAIMSIHKNVKSVLAKESVRHGEYRLRDLRLIGGTPNTEVTHHESGCRFKLDPLNVYFSTRESTERERINQKIKSNEDVLVMFSGVGPFAICIAKKHPTVKVTAIEINPEAHKYCLDNIRLNKIEGQVTPILGDVRDVCPRLDKTFDRVLMPLPRGAYEFLDIAVPMVKPEGVLYFYHWAPEKNPWSEAERLVKESTSKLGRTVKFIDHQQVSQYSPRVYKIRIDAVIH